MNILKNKQEFSIKALYEKNKLMRLIQFVLGCFIISVAYNVFVTPNKMVAGGIGGIAVIINHLTGISNSNFIFIANAFLIVLCYFALGKEKAAKTLLGAIIFPLFIRLTENLNVWLQFDTTQLLLSTVFGGIIYGIGAGFVYKTGYSAGGTDIINQIISKYFKVSIGRSMLFVDGSIVVLSGLFFGINKMIYSIIILNIISRIADRIILGVSDNKMFFIITDEEERIKKYIIEVLGHGVTVYKAKGGFKKEKENVLMTVLPTKEYYKLKEGIHNIDQEAFFIITDSYEVFGGE